MRDDIGKMFSYVFIEHLVDVGIHHDTLVLRRGHVVVPVTQVLESVVEHDNEIALFLAWDGVTKRKG